MSRYAIILSLVLVIVMTIAIVAYILSNRTTVTDQMYIPKGPISTQGTFDSQWTQTKYQHNISKSGGRGHIFNEDGECKLWNAQDKITNGTNASLGDFPCMALLEYQLDENTYSFDCAGSLINQRYVITAAHCLDPSKYLVNVRLGEHDINVSPDCDADGDCQPEPINAGIELIMQHENYSSKEYVNDIGLIRLSMDITYIDYVIRPICITDSTMSSSVGKLVQVVGWGNTGVAKQSAILQKITIPIFDWDQCRQKFDPHHIYPSQLCAGGKDGQDACVRDSGGPLIATFNRRTYIEGIVSYGEGCGKDGVPGIYTRVGYYYDWIKNNLKP